MNMSQLPFKTLRELDTSGAPTVLVRASINVPITSGVVTNNFRIKRNLPTLEYLTKAGCKVVLCGHIGSAGEESTLAIAESLQTLGLKAIHTEAVSGAVALEAVKNLAAGDILVLENVRRDAREKANDPEFARELADLADVYVNEAFAASHREHTSIVGVPKLLPSYAGFNFQHEYEALSAMRQPATPSLFMLGGAKFATKMPLVEKFLQKYDHIFVGGALANDFFKAKGYEVGQSLVSEIDLRNSALLTHPKIILPVDVVVSDGAKARICGPQQVAANEIIMDAGPETVSLLKPLINQAKNILWNGPFGNYEKGFAEQTEATAKLVATAGGHAVVGGGDTIAAIAKLDLSEQFGFLSTAGGAMLYFLEYGDLPGLSALK